MTNGRTDMLLSRMTSCICGLLMLLTMLEPMSAVAQPAVFFEKPTLFFEERGLDPRRNPIDRLLHIYGQTCIMVVRERTGQSCSVENELSAFVDTLPHDAPGLSDALTALGATCKTKGTQTNSVDCVYQKRVLTNAWVSGESEPRVVTYDDFTIRVTAKLEDGVWRPRIAFDRTSEKVK
jgi:hypothetical protein